MKQKLTYREIVREFLLFLKTEHAYKIYIAIVKNRRKDEIKNWGNAINILTIPRLEECFKNDSNIGYLIDRAFYWASTEEGHDFWAGLHQKWRFKMRNVEMVTEKITNN